MKILPLFIAFIVLYSCSPVSDAPLFELKDNSQTGMEFSNDLAYSDEFNVYKYRNFYNGGGVAIGDINNDGLMDVYFTSNQKENKLFLNEGGFSFKDITATAGVGGSKAWSTGVSMVDINADGFIDIYVCNSGDVVGDNKQNELFINQGDRSFKEQAQMYNLADQGFSTHATFFDFDKDGDLDVYLLNNSYEAIGSFDLRRNERPKRDALGGDKLMENQDGIFVDISEQAGIYGSVIGFGLGITAGDIDRDGWDDLFVSNDFFERDYLYINQKDGTFKEVLTKQMKSISGASMGADLADIDNDGYNDLFVTEMLPNDYNRLKTVTTFEDWNKYQYNVKNGYGHQFTRNMLHRNNTNGTFSEVGRFAGVEASDWSWGALFFDMDNDGLRDLFIANGIFQDLTNQDYLQYVSNEEVIKSIVTENKVDYKRLIDIIPSEKVPNQAFKNKGTFSFETYIESGLQENSFSNGAAYGDLDNDGDLDLVINNVNMPAFVYENKSIPEDNNFIKIILKGSGKNTNAFGAKVTLKTASETFYVEQQPIRGFQSSMDPRINMGIGKATSVDIQIEWPTGGTTIQSNIKPNTIVTFNENEKKADTPLANDIAVEVFSPELASPLPFVHKENNFVDFNRERLTYHMCSNEGPVAAIADFNNDGIEDWVLPGAKGTATQIFISTSDTKNQYKIQSIDRLKNAEHTETLVFDADNDQDLDVYLVSGGLEVSVFSDMLYDKLLLNDGDGNFSISPQKFPFDGNRMSTGAVTNADIDNDGDQDLFVGERLKVGTYGIPGSGFILLNDGQGNYSNSSDENTKTFQNLGLITDAVFIDLDEDQDPDLVVVGEFMGVRFFENKGGIFSALENHPLANKKGWWNRMQAVDFDQDGDLDLVLGNHGKNSRFKASESNPIKLYLNDFDSNGSVEGILTFTDSDQIEFPYALRHDLIDQMKSLKKKFPDYESFKNASIETILDAEKLKTAFVQEVNYLASVVLENQGGFNFSLIELPMEAQLSPVYAIEHGDFDADGDVDIVLGGNLYRTKPEVGIYDASHGVFLEQDGASNFVSVKDGRGFSVLGEIRDFKVFDNTLYVLRNNDSIKSFKYSE